MVSPASATSRSADSNTCLAPEITSDVAKNYFHTHRLMKSTRKNKRADFKKIWLALTMIILISSVLNSDQGAFNTTTSAAAQDSYRSLRSISPRANAKFPLKISSNKRYLTDAAGRPFLVHGDSAWSLVAQLKRPAVKKYLDDRRDRGFNTILVSLIEHRFATNAPRNAYGVEPFLVDGDFSTPNEAYFEYADWVIKQAAKRGMLVLLAPAYLGYGGGEDGWYQEMVANGSAKLAEYGKFVGKRYANKRNIVWVNGGDYDPPQIQLVSAIAEGIRAQDPDALHTMHCGPESAAFDCAGGQQWLDLNNVYTYGPVYNDARVEYARRPRMPFFLIESNYENEIDSTTPRLLRTQAYQANLSGAAGQIFGNNPIWHFDGPGIHPAPNEWRQAMRGTGSKSMKFLRKLFDSFKWHNLVPDVDGSLLVSGVGSGETRAVAALDKKKKFALVYIPTSRSVTIDLDAFAGSAIVARWYDPSNGKYKAVSGSPFDSQGSKSFLTPGNNSSGSGDWVLVFKLA